ncbi:MAG: RlpA-like double-psi beta-barrel domain-containing protein [Patescibacteria group bacterium]|nr:RlpA-like double-psi beta-barrel domain-containing protein [Patescibacteria group bacterium]MDD4611125.1 RlpA-like double-psi beta-barrel domain-containing protein [Patescibacteria group bacterium]
MNFFCLRKILLLLILLTLVVGNFANAADGIETAVLVANPEISLQLEKKSIKDDLVVVSPNNKFNLIIKPKLLVTDSDLIITEINEDMPIPWQYNKLSNIYQYDFRNSKSFDAKELLTIKISYDISSEIYKQIFFYNKVNNSWVALPSTDDPINKIVTAVTHLPFSRVAILGNPDVLTVGQASWYSYKKGDFVASPDFPKGSKLRVYNLDYKKDSKLKPYVDVVVNDYGPDRSVHPGRVVDLDKVAFKKIAKTGQGLINVRVEPLLAKNESAGKVLGAKIVSALEQPEISAKSAILIDENTGEVIYEKNSDQVLPIASLSKMVAIKTFLDLKMNNTDEVVSYSVADEEKNYQYCKKNESARVKLKDGDIVTVKDLIFSSLVGSANNAVETLVRYSGLTREDFIKKMNENVSSWGAIKTNFVEPTGLSEKNVSSARDYAIITKEVLKNKIIAEACVTPVYEFVTQNTKEKHRLLNTNTLVRNGAGLKIDGSKTGYLDEAGYCLMSRAKTATSKLISVVLGANTKNKVFTEVENLLKYGSKQLLNNRELARQ